MASPFASRVTKTLPIDFDPPNEVTIRKLAGRHLERARDAYLTDLYLGVRDRGGAAVQKDLQQLFKSDDSDAKDMQAKVEKAKADPLNGLDPYTVAAGGIVGWTYPESLVPERVTEGDATTMRIRAIDDLDEDALRWFATEIMRLTKPSLFQTPAEVEAERKND